MTKKEEYNKIYNLENKDKISKQKKLYYLQNKEKIKSDRKNYYESNKEEVKERVMKYHYKNSDTIKDYKKKYKEDNKSKLKDKQLREKFNITLDDYIKMLDEQNGCCKICKNPETAKNVKYGNTMMLAVDHNHQTGKVRGLLCSRCNPALGAFNDSIETLKLAIKYLEEYETKN